MKKIFSFSPFDFTIWQKVKFDFSPYHPPPPVFATNRRKLHPFAIARISSDRFGNRADSPADSLPTVPRHNRNRNRKQAFDKMPKPKRNRNRRPSRVRGRVCARVSGSGSIILVLILPSLHCICIHEHCIRIHEHSPPTGSERSHPPTGSPQCRQTRQNRPPWRLRRSDGFAPAPIPCRALCRSCAPWRDSVRVRIVCRR